MIGLVGAKQLVEMMGGTVGVESMEGVGSVFWFELLVGKEPHLAAQIDASPSSMSIPADGEVRMRKVLYVEDNPANLLLVERLMARRTDIHLSTAVTGRLGIERAHSILPDLILMDINLPDLSGIEVLQALRLASATSHIPVIAISANAMPYDISKGVKAGFLRYLTKPIKIAEFNEALDQGLEFASRRTRLSSDPRSVG